MPFSKSNFLKDAEVFLADAEKHQEDDLASRMELLRQLELLKQQLEQPMDKVVNQWISVHNPSIWTFLLIFELIMFPGECCRCYQMYGRVRCLRENTA